MALLLTRTTKEGKNSIMIGDDIEIIVLDIEGGQVRLALDVPKDINVRRSELPKREKYSGNF